jgi:hypothetical protein
MTQRADEIQSEVVVPLAAGSDEESWRREAHDETQQTPGRR